MPKLPKAPEGWVFGTALTTRGRSPRHDVVVFIRMAAYVEASQFPQGAFYGLCVRTDRLGEASGRLHRIDVYPTGPRWVSA
jgi:hypothetical protein